VRICTLQYFMYFFVFMEYAYILYLKYDIIFFVFFVFLIYNMFILFSCSIFKQVISYIIEGNLIYVHKYSRSVYIRTSPFCISIFFNIYYPHTEIHKYDPAIYISVLSIFLLLLYVLLPQHYLILIIKYICILFSLLLQNNVILKFLDNYGI